MPWWELIGWLGSVLVVLSLMVPSVRRFRILNLTGSLIATVYNAAFQIWPYAAMNGAIVLINIYWLWRLQKQTTPAGRAYLVAPVGTDDALVTHFVERHQDDIRSTHPRFDPAALTQGSAWITMHEDEVIGLFALSPVREGTATVLLDYVTARFRDYGTGRHLYAKHDLVAQQGITRLRIEADATADPGYFRRLGFTELDGALEKRP